MIPYPKIQSVYKRDESGALIEGAFAEPCFEFLRDNYWIFTEKIDGTNIRVIWEASQLSIKGRTDKSQIPAFLEDRLWEIFRPRTAQFMKNFGEADVCLYGEGCGPKIQKGGGNYFPENQFVLFDVKVGRWWLKREDVEAIAEDLSIPIAPIIGAGPLSLMVAMARDGFMSQFGHRDFRAEWGGGRDNCAADSDNCDFLAEGIVARPAVELFSRNGARIITKIKCRDFNRKEQK